MIVPMERIRVVGTQSLLDQCIKLLQKKGCVHVVKSQDDKFLNKGGLETGMLQKGVAEKLQESESLLFGVRTALTILTKTHPMPVATVPIANESYPEIKTIVKEIEGIESSIRSLSDEIHEIRRYRSMFEEFQPLIQQMESLHDVEVSGIFFEGDKEKTETNVNKFEASLNTATNEAYSIFKGELKERGIPCLVVYPASMHGLVEKKVFEPYSGKIQSMHVPQQFEKRTYATTLAYLFKREKEAEDELNSLKQKLNSHASQWMALLQNAEQWLSNTIDRLRVHNFLALSDKTFWISGWVRTSGISALREQLDNKFEGKVFFYNAPPAPDEAEEVPVLLENPLWARPFERLLSFFPLPVYGSIDPTLLMTFFFPLFFGAMLGDVGYAMIMGMIFWLIKKRKPLDAIWKDINCIIAACSISTGLFGVIYGEFFGKLWYSIGLPHPVFDRKIEIIPLLMAVLILGGLHLSLGNIAGLKLSLSRKNLREGINHVSSIMIIVSIVWGMGILTLKIPGQIVPFLLIAGLILKIFSGKLIGLFESIKIFSNVLSYARLMALGMASVILADLADDLFFASEWMVLGLIAAMGIHLLNFILGVFSPIIQSLRLHYVEFFNQFYEEGAVRFNPLKEH